MFAIFLDIETGGLDASQHSAFEVAFEIWDTSTNQKLSEYQSIIKVSEEQFNKSSPQALQVNGFTWNEIKDKGKEINKIKEEIKTFFQTINIQANNSFFLCQNPSFDRPFFNQIFSESERQELKWPYHWLDLASMYWTKKEGKIEKGLSKDKIANAYSLPPEEKPHWAKQGVEHLVQCYQAVMKDKKKETTPPLFVRPLFWISIILAFMVLFLIMLILYGNKRVKR